MARNLLTALEIKTSTKPKLRDGDGLWLHTGKSGSGRWVLSSSVKADGEDGAWSIWKRYRRRFPGQRLG